MRVSLAGSVFYPSVSQVMELPGQIVCAWRSEEFRDLLLIQQQICLYNTIYNQNKFVLHKISLPLAYLQGMWSLLLQRVFNHPYTLVW